MSGDNEPWYVIVNPFAGSSKTVGKWEETGRRFDELGIKYNTYFTDHRSHARELAYDAAGKGRRRILAVGGDGSVHDVFCGVLDWCAESGTDPGEFYLGVVPIGSGNDWIKSFGIPEDALKVAEIIAAGTFGTEDILDIECRSERKLWIANGAGTGFDSHVCERVNRQKEAGRRSKMIYLKALRHTIVHLKPINIKVIADGVEAFCGACYSVAVGNGRYSGGGMRQVPLADPSDGIIDVLVVPKLRLGEMFSELPRLFNGTIYESSKTLYLRCSSLEIIPLDSNSEDIIEVDGETEGRLPLRISVSGKKINVLQSV